MKIKEIKVTKFKRFTDLTVTGLPETAKLVVMVGPNGSGKTSLFEALNHWHSLKGFHRAGDQDYFEKKEGEYGGATWYANKVQIQFHGSEDLKDDEIRGSFYFRSAYRNEPEFKISTLSTQPDPRRDKPLSTLMQSDQTVSQNYQRLIGQTLKGVYEPDNDDKSVADLRQELVGKIRDSMSRVFDDLNFESIGDPLAQGTFRFSKGSSSGFLYKNLSAGEKSVFDLLVDLIMKSEFYPDAIFCIDEPEAHMHTRLQAKVLRELVNLVPDNSQIWISTHSIGMLKEAEELESAVPGTVTFLDFDNRDFDLTEIIQPAKINRTIWERFLSLAFGEFSELIAPGKIVFCEGTSQGTKYKNFDAAIYAQIFAGRHHDTTFVSIGSSMEIEDIENQSVRVVANILKASTILKFVDRDDKSDAEVKDLLYSGVRTSSLRHIESYLLDDEVLEALCNSLGKRESLQECLALKAEAINASIQRGNPPDDIKSASGQIYVNLKRALGLSQCGDNKAAFLRDTMAPLLTEDMAIYQLLERDIFG